MGDGFIQGRLCHTKVISLYDRITNLLDKGNAMDLIYLDLIKAFVSVLHGEWLTQLEEMGITVLVKWIKSWLKRVILEGDLSDWRKVMRGISWGSVLRLILFNNFISNTSLRNRSVLMKFSSDTKLESIANMEKDHIILQQELHNLVVSSKVSGMKFNGLMHKVMTLELIQITFATRWGLIECRQHRKRRIRVYKCTSVTKSYLWCSCAKVNTILGCTRWGIFRRVREILILL